MSGDVPAPSMYQAPPEEPQSAPQVILQPIPVPQPVPVPQQPAQVPQESRKPEKSDRLYATVCICCSIIIAFFGSLIAIYFIFNAIYDTKYTVALVKRVKVFPNHNGIGDIKLISLDNDQIGIIDGNNFGIREAHVICKQNGFSEKAHAFTIKETFDSKIRPSFIIRNLQCNGDESRIEHCSYDVYTPTNIWQSKLNIAGVVCVSKSK